MRVHFVLHETFEVPGAYLKWAQERGHQVTMSKVYEREALLETVDEIDFLIVMGGPQSPDEDRATFPYYDPQAEIKLIQKAMIATSLVSVWVRSSCLLLMARSMNTVQSGKLECILWI